MSMMLLRQLKSGSEKVIELPNGRARTLGCTNNTFAKSHGFSIGLVCAAVVLSLMKWSNIHWS